MDDTEVLLMEYINKQYDFVVNNFKQLNMGVGSNTYVIETSVGKFILKLSASDAMNHPELEPDLCEYLNSRGIVTSKFIKNKEESYINTFGGKYFHIQEYIEGEVFNYHEAPHWLMIQSAQMLGKIHAVLASYPKLPIGMGNEFFMYMNPEKAKESYGNTLEKALQLGDFEVADDLRYRIYLMDKILNKKMDFSKITYANSHGDYNLNQIISKNNNIVAVIDWTSACAHPICWEVIRSFAYGSQSCIDGEINIELFLNYVREYQQYYKLSVYDLEMMPYVLYYQIAVCDYYRQFYTETHENKHIFLKQAVFATKLMKWFEKNVELLSKELITLS